MKECDKGNSNISSKLHMTYISFNNDRQPVTKTFTSLHYTSPNYIPLHNTSRHFTSSHLNFSQLHFTTLHYPLIWFKLISISYRSRISYLKFYESFDEELLTLWVKRCKGEQKSQVIRSSAGNTDRNRT